MMNLSKELYQHINSQAIEKANKIKINKSSVFLNSDILSVKLEKLFDVVVSFIVLIGMLKP